MSVSAPVGSSTITRAETPILESVTIHHHEAISHGHGHNLIMRHVNGRRLRHESKQKKAPKGFFKLLNSLRDFGAAKDFEPPALTLATNDDPPQRRHIELRA